MMASHSSLYLPPHNRITDLNVIHDFMREFAFADLITASPQICVSHIPVSFDVSSGKYGKITGHLAKANPQHKLFDGNHDGLIVFHGPHAYISPAWYEAGKPAVPTWNFAVVHVGGKLRVVDDDSSKERIVAQLVRQFESEENSSWNLDTLTPEYQRKLRQAIVVFEMEIETLEAKFKLGLERSIVDQKGIVEGLSQAKPERSLREFTLAEINRRA